MAKRLFPVIAAVVVSACANAPTRPPSIARGDYDAVREHIGALIRYEMEKNAIAGMSIALVDDQRIVWEEGFGHADLASGTPATPDTLYRVGSISKLFTATAAMQLAEQGKLDIDRPIGEYIPALLDKARWPDAQAITARRLLTHHAGLPRDRMKGMMNPAPQRFTTLVQDLGEEGLAYPPDLMYAYSNVGISLVGVAIENTSGTPFEEHMRRTLLEPIGMRDASFTAGIAPSTHAAKGYQRRDLAVEYPLRDIPAGGLNASVRDLSRFMSMLFAGGIANGHRIVREDTITAMLRTQNAAVPLDLNFHVGLGWMLSTLGAPTIQGAGTVAHHAGGTTLFHSQVYLLPAHKLGVAVLANSASTQSAVDRIANTTIALALEAKAGIAQPTPQKAARSDAPHSGDVIADFTGDYATIMGFVSIRAAGTQLKATIGGHDLRMVPRADGMLGLDYAVLGLIRVDLGSLGDLGFARRRIDGRDVLIARLGEQQMVVGQRMPPPQESNTWRDRAGAYEIVNLDGDRHVVDGIQLIEERGRMLVELVPSEARGQRVRIPLVPLSDGEAILAGPLADLGERVRVINESGKEWLEVSGYRLVRRTGQ